MTDPNPTTDSLALSVVIPMYNEEESLPHLLARLSAVLDGVTTAYEIVFVDDGSTDGSAALVSGWVKENPRIVLVRQRANFGKSVALNTGFGVARGEVIITMDADLQDEPNEIPTLLTKLDEGYDLVTGLRSNRSVNDPLSKRIPSKVANGLTRWASGVPLRDMNSGFKAYRRELTQTLRLHGGLHRYVPVLAHYKGFKVVEQPVSHNPRQYGKSKYGPARFVSSLYDLMTVLFLSRFRDRPLHLFGTVGALSGGLGVLISLYLSLVWLFTDEDIGTRPLLTLGVLLIIVGVQFVSLGLIADLIISLDRNRDNPTATVRRIERHPDA
jgi:dolichol-phosphate mannosyltransferase